MKRVVFFKSVLILFFSVNILALENGVYVCDEEMGFSIEIQDQKLIYSFINFEPPIHDEISLTNGETAQREISDDDKIDGLKSIEYTFEERNSSIWLFRSTKSYENGEVEKSETLIEQSDSDGIFITSVEIGVDNSTSQYLCERK